MYFWCGTTSLNDNILRKKATSMFQNTQDLYEFFDVFQKVTYQKKIVYCIPSTKCYIQSLFDEFSS